MGQTPRAERYRATAARLRQLAARMRFTEARLQALGLAQKFERLADYAERCGALRVGRHSNIIPFRRAS